MDRSLVTLVCLIGFLLEVGVVVCVLCRRNLYRYFPLGLYMLFSALTTVGGYSCISNFGYSSSAYVYFYYYSDALMTVLMFWVVIHFYGQAFDELKVSKVIRTGAIFLLALTALFSYVVVNRNKDHLSGRFVIELSQNLYFVGVVLTYLLWGTILKLKETRARLVQLVLALGIYFSGIAVAYAFQNLFPRVGAGLLGWVPTIMSAWLPLAWIYTFIKIPEESKVFTAQLEAKATV